MTLFSRALPSVGMYFLYMRCHAVIYSSLYRVSIICNQSLLYLWRILVIYFVFMEIWRIEPRKDSLFFHIWMKQIDLRVKRGLLIQTCIDDLFYPVN